MNIELTDLEEILLYLETTSLEPHNDYTSEFTYKDQKILYKYIKELQQENKQLKEQLLVTQTNEETFRLEMKDITQTLGLDEDTLFDDVKVYVRSLKDNWNKLKEWLKEYEEGTYGLGSYETGLSDGMGDVIKKMQELQGSDSND